MTKYLLFADAHLDATETPDPAYNLVKQIMRVGKFDGVVCLGDLLDFSYISQWTEGMPGLTEGRRLKADFDLLANELKFYKKYVKEIVLLEGNHEFRATRFIQKNPVLEGLIDLEAICHETNTQYVPTNKQPHRLLSDLFITHGLSINKYFSSQLVQNSGNSVVQGHAHRTQMFSYRYPDGKVVTGYGLGTVGPLNPDYVAGMRITGWTQSIGILYVDGSRWHLDIVGIEGNSAFVEGKLIKLTN